jgi:N-methylhydantoinase B
MISYRTPGGGGYGPALERDPALVLLDVVNGKVTPGRARDVYGIVVDGKKRTVDLEATRRLRQEKTLEGSV